MNQCKDCKYYRKSMLIEGQGWCFHKEMDCVMLENSSCKYHEEEVEANV